MLATFLITVSTLWTALVADIVAESATSGGSKLSMLGHVLSRPATGTGIAVLTVLSASAGSAITASVAFMKGRRLERRMAAEIDDRWEAISQRSAGSVARGELLEWRSAELQTTLNELLSKRNELLDEIADLRKRTAESRRTARAQRESLNEASSASGPNGNVRSGIVVVPDIEEAEPEVAPVDIRTLVPTRPRRGSARKRAHADNGDRPQE